MGAQDGLVKAAGTITVLFIVGKVLGFLREASLATVFGATGVTDAYLVSQTIPVVVFFAVGSALGTTFIPVYAQVRKERGQAAAFAMANSLINATLLLSVGFILVGEMLANPLVQLVAPGFRGPILTLTVSLSRIMFPIIAFQALSGLLTGILQTEEDFTVPALVGLSFNVVVITAIVALGPRFGISAVAAGTVAAVAVQAIFQLPALYWRGFRWRPVLDLTDPGLRRIGHLIVPVLVGASAGQAGTIVDRVLASGLSTGSVAALNYASRLQALVPSVLGTAIITVAYPALSKLSAEREWRGFAATFSMMVGLINFILIPVAVGVAVLRVPLVRLVFQRGAFDASATEATAWALLFFCIGTAVFTLRDMLGRAFYAFQDTTAPMLIGIGAVGLNIVLNLALVGSLKQGGLALATSLAGVANAAALIWVLRLRVRRASRGEAAGIGGKAILDSLCRVVFASGVMGAVVWGVYQRLTDLLPGSGLVNQSATLFGAIGAGAVTYAILVLILRVPEASRALQLISAMAARIIRRVKSDGIAA